MLIVTVHPSGGGSTSPPMRRCCPAYTRRVCLRRRVPARWLRCVQGGLPERPVQLRPPTARHTASWSVMASSPSCPRSSTAPRHCRT